MSQDLPRPVPPQERYQVCNLSEASFSTTAELVESVKAGVGQSRAMAAIEPGIAIDHAGYNLFLLGSTGLGKHALIGNVLDERRRVASACRRSGARTWRRRGRSNSTAWTGRRGSGRISPLCPLSPGPATASTRVPDAPPAASGGR